MASAAPRTTMCGVTVRYPSGIGETCSDISTLLSQWNSLGLVGQLSSGPCYTRSPGACQQRSGKFTKCLPKPVVSGEYRSMRHLTLLALSLVLCGAATAQQVGDP